MLNITHYQKNANQNHNEVQFHASQNGCDPSLQAINAGDGVERREHFGSVGANVNLYSLFETWYGDFFKN